MNESIESRKVSYFSSVVFLLIRVLMNLYTSGWLPSEFCFYVVEGGDGSKEKILLVSN